MFLFCYYDDTIVSFLIVILLVLVIVCFLLVARTAWLTWRPRINELMAPSRALV